MTATSLHSHDRKRRPVLITGGCGFLGCNLAAELARSGRHVVALDNLSRGGARDNAAWLSRQFGELVTVVAADVRDMRAVNEAVANASAVLHLAGQVAVTSSLDDPLEDFEINARGTLNVLEAVRLLNPSAPVVFASTNKVYGRLLADDAVMRDGNSYVPRDERLRAGISETAALDLHSPYGCSKGAADQYVRDYARVFGLRTAVLRMSCLYGPRQMGTEDQGWVAHFMIRAIHDAPITIYGSGYQVRDALFVSDAVDAWLRVLYAIDSVSGRIFNLGGGPGNSVSVRGMLDMIAAMRGRRVDLQFGHWRPGDQPWYVSDTAALAKAVGWRPQVGLEQGLWALEQWLVERFPVPAGLHRSLEEVQA